MRSGQPRSGESSRKDGTLPPLGGSAGSSRPSAAATAPIAVGSVPSHSLGRAYDFELRSHVPASTGATGAAVKVTSGAGGGLPGGGRGAISTVKGFSALSPTPARDTAALVRARPGTAVDGFGSPKGMSASMSTSALPSHLTSTADKLEYFLNWNKGWSAEGNESAGATVAGVLTPRTRYDRLAQSVAAVPFTTPSKQSSEESKQESPFTPLRTMSRARTLGVSASSPALLGTPVRTLGSSVSYSSLHGPPLSNTSSSSDLPSTPYDPHRRIPSFFLPPSQFLSAFLPDSAGVGEAVRQENDRAKGQQEKWNALMQARKQRKKSKKAAQRAAGVTPSKVGGESDSSDDSPDDLGDDDFNAAASSSSKSTRKPGLSSGASILHQIHAIVKSVAEEKQQVMDAALAAIALSGGGGGGAAGGKKKKRRGGEAEGGESEEEEQAQGKGGKQSAASASAQSTPEEDAQLQSVIQSYMVTTGIAGSVAAGGASSAGGNSAIKDRDGSSTFTTAKITRDVKLILDYLKGNPVLRQELMEKVDRRAAARKARALAQQQALGLTGIQASKVRQNAALAWHQTAETREAIRKDVAGQQKARRARQQENKAEIDSIWLARAAERDAELMHQFGPEMLARRARENAENDRLAHVSWGWLMLSQLVPITMRFKYKLREIIQARLTAQVASFVTPCIQRSYVMNVTLQLNESRAKALERIKKSLVRYVIRWKWTKRRNACLQVWKFLTLVKSAYSIRMGLKDSSLRSQIIKVQIWWRSMLQVIQSQAMLVELMWNRREIHLIKTWTKKQKRDERAQALKNGGRAGSGGANGRGGSMGSPKSAKSRRMLSAEGTRDFTQTLATFDFRSGAEEQMERDAAQGLAPKKIPAKQKREVILKFVKKRRAMWRQALRNHVHVLAAWHDEHKYDIELRKARSELGVKAGGSGSSNSAAKSSFASADLVPPPRPTLKLLPGTHELDHLIMTASKQYVLSKLRGAMNESQEATSPGGLNGAGGKHNSSNTQRSQGSTSRSQDSSLGSSPTGGSGSGSFNALVSFLPGNANSGNLGLKSMTIAEQMRAKREMLEKIEDGEGEEEEEEEDQEG